MRTRAIILSVFFALAAFVSMPAWAITVPDCEAIATRMGINAGLPEGLLAAISRIESGRPIEGTRRAWPWTLNHAGRGLYFDSRKDAFTYLNKTVASGQRNIDVGCMQINVRWHGENFASISDMLEPTKNVAYAISFLKSLRARTGSWTEAVKQYHSPDPERGANYHRLFTAALAKMDPAVVGKMTMDVRMVAEAEAQTSGALGEGGLFGIARRSGPLFMSIRSTEESANKNLSVTSEDHATEEAYENLLKALAAAGEGGIIMPPMPVDLLTNAPSVDLARRWADVEKFRHQFRNSPTEDITNVGNRTKIVD